MFAPAKIARMSRILCIFLLSPVGVMKSLAQRSTLVTLHSFHGTSDGAGPRSGVVMDSNGNIYGTTMAGGVVAPYCAGGCGVVFKIDSNGKESVVYNFPGRNLMYPQSGVTLGSNGNIYGTTSGFVGYKYGGLYKLAVNEKKAKVFNLNGLDGAYPIAGLARDVGGNFYGTTPAGGQSGTGTVFKLDPQGKQTVLVNFPNSGGYSNSGVILDSAGNLYGTTVFGGVYGSGSVFELSAAGNYTELYSFTGALDGGQPYGGLLRDSAGNIYGTTWYGGSISNGAGVVFKLDAAGNETVLHRFSTDGSDGVQPRGSLVLDDQGNLYGTAWRGGFNDCGTVFKVTSSGAFSILHDFARGSDGCYPWAELFLDPSGNLYGTTEFGGDFDRGVVFKITPLDSFMGR